MAFIRTEYFIIILDGLVGINEFETDPTTQLITFI